MMLEQIQPSKNCKKNPQKVENNTLCGKKERFLVQVDKNTKVNL